MTEIRTSNGVQRITKRCKQTASCLQNEAHNENQCRGDNPVCNFCCQGDLCNFGGSSTCDSILQGSPTLVPASTKSPAGIVTVYCRGHQLWCPRAPSRPRA